jgi:hypothetical protein
MIEIGEIDVVRLTRPFGRWPAGSEGTVVNVVTGAPVVTVEMPGIEESEDDVFDYLPEVPLEFLELVWRYDGPHDEPERRAWIPGPSETKPAPGH